MHITFTNGSGFGGLTRRLRVSIYCVGLFYVCSSLFGCLTQMCLFFGSLLRMWVSFVGHVDTCRTLVWVACTCVVLFLVALRECLFCRSLFVRGSLLLVALTCVGLFMFLLHAQLSFWVLCANVFLVRWSLFRSQVSFPYVGLLCRSLWRIHVSSVSHFQCLSGVWSLTGRGGGLGSSTIFQKFNEPYAPS